jgi:hypothetical protein
MVGGAASKLRRLSWADRGLLVEAVACLGVARLAVVALPFRAIAPHLGTHMAESPATDPPDPVARRVAWAIAAAGRRTPWRSKCLEQAIAGKMMLRRRGIASTMYLGVVRTPFESHAWLRVGELNVTGGAEVDRYAVLATFADAGRG